MVQIEGFYELTIDDARGKKFTFDQLRGKKVIIVNSASECGYTPQLAGLQELFEKFASNGLVVLAFPCNDFGNQEPGSNDEILEFCESNFGVTFPVLSKVSIAGKNKHEIFQRLMSESSNHFGEIDIVWNFNKILIDENGCIYKNIAPAKEPDCPEIIQWLTQQSLF
jgi:glutathione peroxidase